MNPLRTRSTPLLELESLRGMAALLVVMFHVPKWHPMLDVGLINNGYLMVDFFFVLSGFVIASAYATRMSSLKDLASFQFLRLGRLYPVHLVFLLFFLGIEIAKWAGQQFFGLGDLRIPAFSKSTPGALVEQLLLLQAVLPNGHALTYNAPAWSISVEFYTYIVFGIMILLFPRWKERVFVAIAVSAIATLFFAPTGAGAELRRCLAGFFIGCVVQRIAAGTTDVPVYGGSKLLIRHAPAMLIAALLGFLAIKTPEGSDLPIYALSALLVLAVVRKSADRASAGGVLVCRPLVLAGTISYSVYMSHTSVLWALSNLLARVLRRPQVVDHEGKLVSVLGPIECVVVTLVAVGLVLLFSYAVYKLVEEPMRLRSRHLVESWQRPLARAEQR